MKPINLMWLILLFGLPQPGCAQNNSCDANSARILGRLYYLANPINEQTNHQSLVNFIQQNSQYLQVNSAVIQCCRMLGQRLIYQGLNSFNQSDYNSAYESTMNMGATKG
jgi:hypothetical protein